MNDLQKQASHILIVDDDPNNIQVLEAILLEESYQIQAANNGLEAIRMIKKRSPDLILMDVIMPLMDGFETCEKLKTSSETKDIPIIFLTAQNETDDVIKGFEVGAADYVSKPFNISILLARVKTHLALQHQAKQLKAMAEKDGLTMIANRRRFDDFLDVEWRRCIRNGVPISLIMIDIDCFKLYNDNYGHLKGDEALKQIAKIIYNLCNRPGDLAARYGGEEFSVVLGNTDSEMAYVIAEKIRSKIERLNILHEHSIAKNIVTVSLGVNSIVPTKNSSSEQLIKAADERLYEAKKAGRNQIK